MKYSLIIVLSLFLISCKKEVQYKVNQSYTLQNISYGKNSFQKMDIYLPKDRSSETTKLFVLIHGGGWSAGNKTDFAEFFNNLKTLYPHHAIININYRLGTKENPGFPKQINDIQAALDEIRSSKYNVSKETFLLGGSAGAHLALLYGYVYDEFHNVKGICNMAGPTDFTDTFYTENPLLQMVIQSFVGNYSYQENPAVFVEASPAKKVTAVSPKTISFYGDADEIVAPSQMVALHSQLDTFNVYNEYNLYPGEGHSNLWSEEHLNDFAFKLAQFIGTYFDY